MEGENVALAALQIAGLAVQALVWRKGRNGNGRHNSGSADELVAVAASVAGIRADVDTLKHEVDTLRQRVHTIANEAGKVAMVPGLMARQASLGERVARLEGERGHHADLE